MLKESDLNTIKTLVEEIIEDLVHDLSQHKDISIEESLDIVYNSMIYRSLCNQDTNLYNKGSSYVYELLKIEIQQEL
ncbi:MAG: hypothetical protein H7Y18_10140 [Clostridiaceae bacterium]|nr:hypothetical protein [Clostridiaceae bacterium]